MARRSRGEDSIYFDHRGTPCSDLERHRHCSGRWRGEVFLGYGPDGRRKVHKVSRQTKTAVAEELKAFRRGLDAGLKPAPAAYTVKKAAEDWLSKGLRASSDTVKKNRYVLEPVLAAIGQVKLVDLDLTDVDLALATMASSYSITTVSMARNALSRVLRYAMARKLISLDVADLANTPEGQAGRPSRSLSTAQVEALLHASENTWMHAYIALSVGTGIRTEEIRALRWENVSLDTDPPFVEVWRSVRAEGKTKTTKSRRTGTPDHVLRNRVAWDRWAAEYAGPGRENWAAAEPSWGIWHLPKAQLGLLPPGLHGAESLRSACWTRMGTSISRSKQRDANVRICRPLCSSARRDPSDGCGIAGSFR
jgi:integrase